MNRKELQQALKTFREQGLTSIRLTAATEKLQLEYNLIQVRIGMAEIEAECDEEKAKATAEDKAETQAAIDEMLADDPEEEEDRPTAEGRERTLEILDEISNGDEKEASKVLFETLHSRYEGATDEARMQNAIDEAGLYEEMELAWHSIPGYSDFEEIFKGDAGASMFLELMMPEEVHQNYVRVCQEAQRVEQEFSRRALEKLISQ